MSEQARKQGIFQKFLKTVEWLGNCLPHPVFLFLLFCVAIMCASSILSWLDLSVMDPRPAGAKGRSIDGIITVNNLLSADGIRNFLPSIVKNFSGFAPLGTVLVTMLGVGIAEYSGLLTTGMRALVLSAPKKLIPYAVVFAGIMSNLASEMGYVVLIPLGGYIFLAVGRHPLAGLAAAFAGVSGGYSANIVIGTIDPLLSGITQEAAQLIRPGYEVHPMVNWYFMVASTFLVTLMGGLVTTKIVEPNLGKFDASEAGDTELEKNQKDLLNPITQTEKKALLWAAISVGIIAIIAALTVFPEGAFLRNQQSGDILKSPFMKSIIPIIVIFFTVPSIVFGWVMGTIRTQKDLIQGMESAMSRLGLYIVIVFFAAQFIALFKQSNLGLIFAIQGAELLKAMNLTGPMVFFPFILLCGFINLMIGSASAQWAVTSPIFIPMLMLIGFAPETIQAAYRIGDSTTNIITPLMSYFGLILAFADRFRKDIGVGTIVATMLPYSIVFITFWSVFFYIFVFVLGFPVGPGSQTYLP